MSTQIDLKLELSASELEHKIRLLTLASLAFNHIGQNLPYFKVAEGLQVDPSEVEKWVIDGTYWPVSVNEFAYTFIQSFVLVLFGASFRRRRRAFTFPAQLHVLSSASNGWR